jgi:selenide,water dikinase
MEDLVKVLRGLPKIDDPNLIVGLGTGDDAGVYRISDDLALIQTVDVITPIVDDPFTFGQIAVANSLSDVYAMGGKPLTAMNIINFPDKKLSLDVLREIILGGMEKMKEAGVTLVGGHTIKDEELKYGVSVTGTIRPDKVVDNAHAKPGDKLILTKPIGTGVISTANKRSKATPEAVEAATKVMAALNAGAADALQEIGASACTDITGFGLLGEGLTMAKESGASLRIWCSKVPLILGALDYAEAGHFPGGSRKNKEYCLPDTEVDTGVPAALADLMFDAQTSGGLLISLDPEKAEEMLGLIHKNGTKEAAIIGEVADSPPGKARLLP